MRRQLQRLAEYHHKVIKPIHIITGFTIENRKTHNRRICYEVSRYLAKSLSVLFKDRPDVNICIFWDKGLTHYFVGLSGREYSVALDLDDFTYINNNNVYLNGRYYGEFHWLKELLTKYNEAE